MGGGSEGSRKKISGASFSLALRIDQGIKEKGVSLGHLPRHSSNDLGLEARRLGGCPTCWTFRHAEISLFTQAGKSNGGHGATRKTSSCRLNPESYKRCERS